MEFGKKLYELRKSKELTQEELAAALYVSRTAISKWESGRGYPSIDSLKTISEFFSISIDDLLSVEKIISIAEKENKENIKSMYSLFFGICDILYFMLIVLPLYSNSSGGHIYAINLIAHIENATANHIIYPIIFLSLIMIGTAKIILLRFKTDNRQKLLTFISVLLGMLAVLLLALTREAYATSTAFLLLVIKGWLLLKYIKTEN